jgi:hypothetical protein
MRRCALCVMLGAVLVLVLGGAASAQSQNGRAGQMPAYYDGKLFTINFKLQPPNSGTLAHNNQINTIYMSDQAESAGVMFISVLDAIQGDGFNPLWREVQIVFLTISPQQFTSDNDILAAAAAGKIRLDQTNELYRCSVVGPKK